MLVTQKRPRNLDWHHAGPLLFGDWGTSRLYVLGLAFFYTAHASVIYLLAMSVIMAAVAWAYTVICRCFPEGGGVYTAARQIHPLLAVIGATLLLCDYVVTAALSVVEGFHYFGVPHHLTVLCSVVTIVGLGVLNWFGARSAGRFALLVALAAIVFSAAIAVLCLPYLPKGLSLISWEHQSSTSMMSQWESLVRIVLALSGVEAVANMTGLMREPVARTSKRTIWPVLCEVIVLNLIFGIALTALPALASVGEPWHRSLAPGAAVSPEIQAYRDVAMKQLAIQTGQNAFGQTFGFVFGKAAAIVFGLLLLSAVNTAIMAMVSVMFSMSHDRELPRPLGKLNYSGVPWIGLLVACVLPVAILLLVGANVPVLAELYAIGVVGAIMISVLSCAVNSSLPIARWERIGLWALGLLMVVIELTIVYAKWRAAVFAAVMIATVLIIRYILRARQRRRIEEPLPVPVQGWLAELEAPQPTLDASKPRIMLAARGRNQAEFAVDLARKRSATLFVIYVRTLRLMDIAPGAIPRVQDDPQALESLGTAATLARRAGVPFVPIYVCSDRISEEILDYTVTFGCDTLILGRTRRRALSRRIEGDVVAQIVEHLPGSVELVLREAKPIALGPDSETSSAVGEGDLSESAGTPPRE